MTCCKSVSRYCVAPVTLTLEPCYPNSNPKGSYIGRRTSSLIHVGTLQFARAHAHERNLGFWGVNGVPLGPDPNPRVGQGRGPPGQSLPGGHVGIP